MVRPLRLPSALIVRADDMPSVLSGRILEWDMRATRPRILATLETSVGYFTMGDVYNDEMPLIA